MYFASVIKQKKNLALPLRNLIYDCKSISFVNQLFNDNNFVSETTRAKKKY